MAQLPCVKCEEKGIKQIDVSWTEERSRFTALFEILVIDWLKETSVSAVARQLGIRWDAIDGIKLRAVARGIERRDDTGLLPDLDVGETAFCKRHDYLTVISDPFSGAVVHLCDGRKMQRLKDFYNSLSEEQRTGIKTISIDIWRAFISTIPESIPDAESRIGFDVFLLDHLAGKCSSQATVGRRPELRAPPPGRRMMLDKPDYLRMHAVPDRQECSIGNLDRRSIVVDISECPFIQLKVGIEIKREVRR